MKLGRRGFLRGAGAAAVAAPFAGQAIADQALKAAAGNGLANQVAAGALYPPPGISVGSGGSARGVLWEAARALLDAREREEAIRRQYRSVLGFDQDIAALRSSAVWWRMAQQQLADQDRQSALDRLRKEVWG